MFSQKLTAVFAAMPECNVLCLQGRTVSFKNAIIILTSNLGSKEIYRASAGNSVVDVTRSENVRTLVMDQVSTTSFGWGLHKKHAFISWLAAGRRPNWI